MTTEMQMMPFMNWMAKSCAVKGIKLLLPFFWTLYCKSKLAVFPCHHYVHTAFQVIYWWQSPEKTGRLRWRHGCNGAFFSGSRLSMLAPGGAEVAAQEWDALVVVVVVVGAEEAIGPLAAADPGEDKFSLLPWSNLFQFFCKTQISFLFPDTALLFALSTDSLWRTCLRESAGR